MFNDVLKIGQDPNRGFGWRCFCLSYACFEFLGYKYSSLKYHTYISNICTRKYAVGNIFQVQNITFLGTKYILWFFTHGFQILPIKRKAKQNLNRLKDQWSKIFQPMSPSYDGFELLQSNISTKELWLLRSWIKV